MTDPYKRDRRIGRWFITDQQQRAYPGILQHIQDSVLVLRAWPEMTRDRIEFMGRGPQFDVVDEGDLVPEYIPRIVDERVEWTRVGPPVVTISDPIPWDWTAGQPIYVNQREPGPKAGRFLRVLKAISGA